ncbi:MAG: fumarate hydratase [Christensenellaceae bacterium]|jgi:fumarate hydratase subunit alpha
MKDISVDTIRDTVRALFLAACIRPGEDVDAALLSALDAETVPHAKEILKQLIENNRLAEAENIPACQDTGMAVVMADIGQDVHITGGFLDDAITEGVRAAYQEGYFRKSVLDPISRVNTKDNTPAVIHTRIVAGDNLSITVLPKGFGSENMSQLKMLTPSDGKQGIIDFIVETAKDAGGSPCPPVVLGVGIGGTFEYAALLAKRQLLREIGSKNPDAGLAEMEEQICGEINALHMGPMGLGGQTYCLAVHIDKYPTHIAGLPVAVNYCCHMMRHKTAVL